MILRLKAGVAKAIPRLSVGYRDPMTGKVENFGFLSGDQTIEIKDDLADSEIQKLVRLPGVTYIREDIAVE